MLRSSSQLGKKGEALAVRELKRRGYKIISQGYTNTLGEIDIIAKEGGTWVFVEVKTRRSSRFGGPKYAITSQKQKKISMVALSYLKENGQMRASARFDVVAITVCSGRESVEIIKNAFDLAYF